MQLSIDIGTCFSKAAFVLDGKVTFVKDHVHHTYMYPSSAYVDSQNRVWVGQRAEAQLLADPTHSYRYFKRDLGSNKPYPALGKNIDTETLIAATLWQFRQDAEQMLGSPATTAAIAIPKSYKTQTSKSRLLQNASKDAGFNRVELLEDAIAVAAYYDTQRGIADKERVLVYDLGGTFDATVIQKKGGHYECFNRSIPSEHCGGGIAFDIKIYEDLTQHIQRVQPDLSGLLNSKNTTPESVRVRRILRDCCIKFKHQLSVAPEIDEHVQLGLPAIAPIPYLLTRSEFETMIAPFIEETINYCNQVVREAGFGWQDIGQVLLVGGSCHIPYVKERVEQKLRRSVTLLKDPDTAACQGTAMYMAQGRASKPDLLTALAKWTQDFLKEGERSQAPIVPVLRYVDAVTYFVRKRPPDPRIQKGAMLRQAHSQGQVFTQVFLDENSTPVYGPDGKPYGRRLIARQFDVELRNAFGDQQLIIVE
jgi:molecular chaperone DnaK (HSP70)